MVLHPPRTRPSNPDTASDSDKIKPPAAGSPTAPKRGPGRPKGVKDSLPGRRRKPADPDLAGHQAALVDRCLTLIEDRAERRLKTTLTKRSEPRPRSRAAWVQRQCPDIEAARAAFLTFAVPPGCRVCPPAAVRNFVRLVLFRAQHPIVALSVLMDGDLGRFASQYASAVLQGQRPVVADEWARIRAIIQRLAVGLSLEHEPEPGAVVDFAATFANGLNRPASRSRDTVNPELVAIAMQAPLRKGHPRAAFPRYTRLATAAA
jgi:hypothetical protein